MRSVTLPVIQCKLQFKNFAWLKIILGVASTRIWDTFSSNLGGRRDFFLSLALFCYTLFVSWLTTVLRQKLQLLYRSKAAAHVAVRPSVLHTVKSDNNNNNNNNNPADT